MYKDFDFKKLFFRIAVVGGTLFLTAFIKQYAITPDLTQSFHAGVAALLQGAILAIGGDQLVYHYQTTKAEDEVKAQMRAQALYKTNSL